MTVHNKISIWDDGKNQLWILPVEESSQYHYINGIPCITFDISYENSHFKGFDRFTLFDKWYADFLNGLHDAVQFSDGYLRLNDVGADTDGYIDFAVSPRGITVSGQLGASYSDFRLNFSFQADQTMLQLLESCLSI